MPSPKTELSSKMKKLCLLALVLLTQVCSGQTVIYRDNMEDTGWTWKGVPSLLINSSYVGGVSRAVDAPPNTPLYTSFDTAFALFGNGLGSSAVETDTLIYYPVPVNPLAYYRLRFKICSFGMDTTVTNSPAGVDVSDYVQLEYSVNGGPYMKELKVTGNNNLKWSYSNNSIIKLVSGSNNTIGLSRSIGTVGIDLPLGMSQLSCRITMVLNGSGESWFIDDVELVLLKETALPVELTEFNGKYYNAGIKLYWTTLSETNNDHFDLLKSFDGINYFKLKTINGRGNSSIPTYYEYVDYEICDEIVYYKLKQVDYDGISTEYYPIAFKCRHPFLYDDFFDVLGRKVKQDYDGIKIQQK